MTFTRINQHPHQSFTRRRRIWARNIKLSSKTTWSMITIHGMSMEWTFPSMTEACHMTFIMAARTTRT